MVCTGVNLIVNESLHMNEGDVQEVCVTVDNHEQSRERSIPLKVVSHGLINGMKPILYTYRYM